MKWVTKSDIDQHINHLYECYVQYKSLIWYRNISIHSVGIFSLHIKHKNGGHPTLVLEKLTPTFNRYIKTWNVFIKKGIHNFERYLCFI